MTVVDIENDLYKELKRYCDENFFVLRRFVNRLIKEKFDEIRKNENKRR